MKTLFRSPGETSDAGSYGEIAYNAFRHLRMEESQLLYPKWSQLEDGVRNAWDLGAAFAIQEYYTDDEQERMMRALPGVRQPRTDTPV